VNDIEETYVSVAEGILSEMLTVVNHSTTLDAFNENAACLYGYIKPRWHDDRRRVIITSPPYGRLDSNSKFARGYDHLVITKPDNMALFSGKHLRAAWLGILSSIYLCLRGSHNTNDIAIIVLKNFKNTGLHKKGLSFLQLTRELAEFVGFKIIETLTFKVETRFTRYHQIKGNDTDAHHEYAVVLRKVV